MATTTNFGWETPDDTDLVKDGALAMRTLGNAIDTSLVDLKGGTTGQVLSKNSNTDMDFTWVTSDDANAIQNAIVDAKGDLIAATANDTPARLAVGSNGDTLVADSAATTGLRWQGDYAAGKNKIINGAFNIWQRGTTFTNPANLSYTADRFTMDFGGASGGTVAWSQQTFTPGTAPVAGYEGQYFARYNMSVASTGQLYNNPFEQRIEDVRTLAGQAVTFSAWVKSDSSRSFSLQLYQNFGSGGSTQVAAGVSSTFTATTSWQRFSFTVTMPSVSGKTIGAGSHVKALIGAGANNTVQTIDTWGWQLEAGSVATAFQTATGTLQGELAACQRYLPVHYVGTTTIGILGQATGSGVAYYNAPFLVQPRVAPTGITITAGTLKAGTSTFGDGGGTGVFNSAQLTQGQIVVTGASGLTAGNASYIYPSTTATILWTGCEL
jgi:hypothetical protein